MNYENQGKVEGYMERELTLKDMLVILLKRAKLIVVLTLVFGLLLGAFGVYRSYSSQAGAAGQTDVAAQYEKDVENAGRELERAKRQEEEAQAYLDNSLYYAIDPYNKGVSSLLFYVDTGYEIDPALNYQSLDRTGHVVAAYTETYKYDEEMLDHLGGLLGDEIDKKYIFELIDVVNAGNYMVRITVVHEDAEVASDIAHYIYETTKRKAILTVAEHTTQVLADYSGYEVDTELRTEHETSEANLENAKTDVEEKQAALDELLANPVTATASGISMTTLLKQGIKYGVLGLVVGCVIGCVAALFVSMMGGKLENTADAVARYKFPVLGVLPQEHKGRWFDGWIKALEGEPKATYEGAAKVISANLETVAGNKKVMLVSTGDKAMADKLTASLMSGAKENESDKLIEKAIFTGGNVLEDASTVEALKDVDAVVLVEQRGKARMEQVDSEVLRLEALDKEILGIVLC